MDLWSGGIDPSPVGVLSCPLKGIDEVFDLIGVSPFVPVPPGVRSGRVHL